MANPGPKRSFPHVDQVTDPAAQQSLRLLWDKVFGHDAQLQDLHAASTVQSDTLTTLAQHALTQAGQAKVLVSRTPVGPAGSGGSDGGGGSGTGGSTGGTDDGFGQQGFDAAGPTGHVPAGSPLSPFTAGQIVGGVANEFPALQLPTTDDAARNAQQAELLERMIWHLNLAGFTAGRQKNPSGVIGINRLTVYIGGGTSGELRAYKVDSGADFSQPYSCYMRMDFPPSYVPDGGTPD